MIINSTRTKIVATIGPSSSQPETLRRLAAAGVDVFRLNFSHGTHDEHLGVIRSIRKLCVELNRPFGILGDLSGPKLRIGDVAGGRAEVQTGDSIYLTSAASNGENNRFFVNFPSFHAVTKPGESVLIDDGSIRLTVESISGHDVRCRVENGGFILPRKGVNLPNTRLPIPALTDKDRNDLRFALENDVDMLALSFVRSAADLEQARGEMQWAGRTVPLLAKIEKAEAVANLESILDVADGAMVARGDLGIEIPMEMVPAVQKKIIGLCNVRRKPVITATQMLDSMIRNPRPTRAEVTDIYNAILDGTDAVMLSGETASGSYPVESVEVMNRVAREAEESLPGSRELEWIEEQGRKPTTGQVIAHAAVKVAERLNADCIISPTWSGATALRVSQFRPRMPIFACSTETGPVNALCLAWGVESRIMASATVEEIRQSEGDALVNASLRCAVEHDFLKPGMKVVVLGGIPLGQADSTNFLRVVEIK
ncbi:MAG: pyruvate kinase [Candidatus Sumerlaeaceae bacterium]|nr:pyruvate kinase [Candidatus Sumerlaeaceae bacterium]